MADPAQTESPSASHVPPSRSTWIKFIVGTVAILLWGLFFDDLARVARWIFDSSYFPQYRPFSDLQGRLLDAHLVLTHGSLYAIRQSTFTYPPVTAYLFVPFRAIGLRATETVWTVGNMVALAVIFAVSLRRWFNVSVPDAWLAAAAGLAPAAVFAFWPFRSLLLWGQLGVFLMLLVFLDLFVMPKRYRGFLVGIAAAIKILPALFVVWFIIKREIPAVIRAAVGFGVLTLGAAVLWPHASALYWFHVLPSVRVGRIVAVSPSNWFEGVGKLDDQSLRGMLGRPPFLWFGSFPWFAVVLAVLGVGIATAARYLRQGRELVAFIVLSLITELVSPVSWLHYWVFVGLAPLLAVLEWRRDRPLAIASIVLALSTCANLETNSLGTAPFTAMSPAVLFVVRNLYVLGGLIFLGVAIQRAFRSGSPTEEEGPVDETIAADESRHRAELGTATSGS